MSSKFFMTISCLLCVATSQAQNVGININNPLFNLDVRGTDNATDGGEFQLATPGETNFLRLLSGTTEDPHPSLVFSDTDTFHLATTGAKFVRRVTLLPNGKLGLSTDLPIADLDVRAGSTSDPGLINLSTKNGSNFLRLYSGLPSEPYPTLYWKHGDTLDLGMSNFDDSNFQRFVSLDGKTIGVHNTGGSVFIGEGAGTMDNTTNNNNVAIGDSALHNQANGNGFIAIGKNALQSQTSGNGNVAIGSYAAPDLISGGNNVFVGEASGFRAVDGGGNTIIGSQAGNFMGSAVQNTAIGHLAGFGILDGQSNVYIGVAAGGNQLGTPNSDNVLIGSAAGLQEPGNKNTVVGTEAGINIEGERNVVLGYAAGSSLDSFNNSIIIGAHAGEDHARDHTLIIENSNSPNPLIYGEFDNNFLRINGEQEVSGELNIDKTGIALRVYGDEALWYDSTYFSWGFDAGHNYFARPLRVGPVEGGTTPFADLHVVDDSGNTHLTIESYTGDAVLQLAGNTNSPNNGWTIRRPAAGNDLVWRFNNSHKMVLTEFGNLGLGVTNPTNTFEMEGTFDHTGSLNGNDSYVARFRNTSNNNSFANHGIEIVAGHTSPLGNSNHFLRFSKPDGTMIGRIFQNGYSSVAYFTTSDRRLKEDIVPTEFGLDEILQLEVRDYFWKNDAQKQKQTGLIAQQVQEIFPQAAVQGSDDPNNNPWGVAPMQLIPLLVKGMQEQQTLIEELQSELDLRDKAMRETQEQIKVLTQRLNDLESRG